MKHTPGRHQTTTASLKQEAFKLKEFEGLFVFVAYYFATSIFTFLFLIRSVLIISNV